MMMPEQNKWKAFSGNKKFELSIYGNYKKSELVDQQKVSFGAGFEIRWILHSGCCLQSLLIGF